MKAPSWTFYGFINFVKKIVSGIKLDIRDFLASVLKKKGFVLVGCLNFKDAQFGNWIDPWLANKFQAEMKWMTRNGSIRQAPCTIEDYGKSIISFAYPYYTGFQKAWGRKNLISNYAWGEDYHKVLRKKVNQVMSEIAAAFPDFQGRCFVDTAPIPEKVIASRCGLGWIGKNSLLINKKFGSYLFLAEIISNLDLQSTPATGNYCKNCTRCLDECPTQAILPGSMIDANRCLSYLTIEKRGLFSLKDQKHIKYQLFGCDICQQVCPWNKKLKVLVNSPFSCYDRWSNLSIEDFAEMSEEQFKRLKEKSPVKRTGLSGMRRNAQAILRNQHQRSSTSIFRK